MILLFDLWVNWTPTAGDLDEGTERRYFAIAPPSAPILAILVLQEAAAKDFAGPGHHIHNRRAECSIGDHAANAPVGYTLPQYAGLKHTKITVRRFLDNDGPVDERLSNLLAGAPDPELERAAPWTGAEPCRVFLPPVLVEAAHRLCGKLDIPTFDALVWQALLEKIERDL